VRESRSARSDGGLARGCCLAVLVPLALVALLAWSVDRALAAPDLGAGPRGPDHGESQTAIAAVFAQPLAAQLAAHPHGVITLSEHDLTVIANEHNPNRESYHHLTVRIRDDLLVLSADVAVGPLTVRAVAHVGVAVEQRGAQTVIATSLRELDAGQLTLPGWFRDRYRAQVSRSMSISSLFGVGTVLRGFAGDMDCVGPSAAGLRISLHRPGDAAQPDACAA